MILIVPPKFYRHATAESGKTARLYCAAGSEAKGGGQGFAVLAEPSSSPSRMRLVESLKAQYPSMIWAEYSPLHDAASEHVLTELLDQPARALPRLAETKRILSIDADFLTGDNGIAQSRAFASTRKVKDKEAKQMSRLYVVESSLTQTGSMADHRLPELLADGCLYCATQP